MTALPSPESSPNRDPVAEADGFVAVVPPPAAETPAIGLLPPRLPPPPPTLGARGDIVIGELLGQGGFGCVWSGRYRSSGGLDREVAVKVLSDNADPTMLARLRDEARILALLHHPVFVRVHDLVPVDSGVALVLERVHGADVRTLLRQGAFPPVAAAGVVSRVAEALDVAWNHLTPDGRPLHLSHRDLKPGNVMIGANGDVRLLDFGVAWVDLEEREATTTDGTLGSVGYMAPERLGRQEHDLSDVYSLGVVWVELLTGVRFGRTSELPLGHREHVARALSGVQVPAIVRRMLSYRASDRPEMHEVAEAAAAVVGPSNPAVWLRTMLRRSKVDGTDGDRTELYAQDDSSASDAALSESGELPGDTPLIDWTGPIRATPGAPVARTPPAPARPAESSRPIFWALTLMSVAAGFFVTLAGLLVVAAGAMDDQAADVDDISVEAGPVEAAPVEAGPVEAGQAVAPPAPAPPPEPVVVSPAPRTLPPAAPRTTKAAPKADPVEVVPAPPPTSAHVTPAPKEEPEPAEESRSWVGAPKGLSLRSADGTTWTLPGAIPPGHYEIRKSGAGKGWLTVPVGEVVRLECDAMTCSPR